MFSFCQAKKVQFCFFISSNLSVAGISLEYQLIYRSIVMNTMLFISLAGVSSGARIWLVRIFTVNKIKKDFKMRFLSTLKVLFRHLGS